MLNKPLAFRHRLSVLHEEGPEVVTVSAEVLCDLLLRIALANVMSAIEKYQQSSICVRCFRKKMSQVRSPVRISLGGFDDPFAQGRRQTAGILRELETPILGNCVERSRCTGRFLAIGIGANVGVRRKHELFLSNFLWKVNPKQIENQLLRGTVHNGRRLS